MMAIELPSFDQLPIDQHMVAELRSDHAGEWGAVAIYEGVLAVSRDATVRDFARSHMLAERRHRDFFTDWLPRDHHSRLLRLWYASGWSLGAVAALFGTRVVYMTIAAVETFVERHYLQQIDYLDARPGLEPLASLLAAFCADEVHHRDDARHRLTREPGVFARLWTAVIGSGSAAGVALARRF